MTISADTALYIKLGERGKWERECINETQTLHLDYSEIPHSLCVQGKWDEVKEHLVRLKPLKPHRGSATNHVRQIRAFYESGNDVLWITFFANRLWWCFSPPELTFLADGSKTRPVRGSWQSQDVKGGSLDMSRLSGKLLSMQGFQGTICAVREREYLLQKINAESPVEVKHTRSARDDLIKAIEPLIRHLQWQDFEILVDLIFRQAGWMRISDLGGLQKTTDLVLVAPITGEQFAVQVKSQANLAIFKEYEDRLAAFESLTGAYFVVHSPSRDLDQYSDSGKIKLLRPAEIAQWSVRYGLVDWIIGKAG